MSLISVIINLANQNMTLLHVVIHFPDMMSGKRGDLGSAHKKPKAHWSFQCEKLLARLKGLLFKMTSNSTLCSLRSPSNKPAKCEADLINALQENQRQTDTQVI